MTEPALDDCGCCGAAPEEAAPGNPPGQAVLTYRSGTQTSVLRRMLARLVGELPRLTARDPDDPAVALLDAWATVADVVTFYQERIVTEGFLRTATERASVLELARSIGYELRPGVAASTHLHFSVDSVPAAPPGAVAAERTKVRSVPGQGEQSQTFETGAELPALAELNEVGLRIREPQQIGPGTKQLYLAGVTTGLRPGDAVLVRRLDPAGERRDFRILRTVLAQPGEPATTLVSWDDQVASGPSLTQAEVEVNAFRLRAALFGQNAPDFRSMPDVVRNRYAAAHTPPVAVPPADNATWPGFSLPATGGVIDLDAAYPAVGKGSWLVLSEAGRRPAVRKVDKAELAGGEDFGVTGRTTRVKLVPTIDLSRFDRRKVVVFTQSERLDLADQPIDDPVTGRELELDRVVPFAAGSAVFVTATTRSDTPFIRLATIQSVGPGALVTLDADLPGLRRDSVRLLGNVVPATHGETVADEVLGSGDGTLTHQRFTLRKPELTHVSARTASGVLSTLEVRVDGVLWSEVPSLFLAGPQDRVYVVRIDDEARATVVFGDGVRGARLPTGQENVIARYRSGIGPAGRVPADSLTLLPQRPLGIATVTNPLPATGGVAPEQLAAARVNAPLTVLTLDRVVSLQDHEDFARAFSGIGKARAVALPVGSTMLVHLTVAAEDGTAVDAITITNLRDAIGALGGTADRLRVDSVRPTRFDVGVALLADPTALRSTVDAAVAEALQVAFAADRRPFGQPVTAAEVLAAVAAVPGVLAATLTVLDVANGTGRHDVLVARDARFDPTPQQPDRILPAELLVVDPDRIVVTVMAP